MRVLRLRWISEVLAGKYRNERTREPGGTWSVLAHYENLTVAKAGSVLSGEKRRLLTHRRPQKFERRKRR